MNSNQTSSHSLIRASQQVNHSDSKIIIGPQDTSGKKAEIKIHESGNQIQSIEIKCSCGETILVDCQYNSPGEE